MFGSAMIPVPGLEQGARGGCGHVHGLVAQYWEPRVVDEVPAQLALGSAPPLRFWGLRAIWP